MKTFRLSIVAVTLLVSVWAANAQQIGRPVTAGAPVSYCELIRHAKQYDGKNVSVRAAYRYGSESQEMFDMKCRDQGKTRLEIQTGTLRNAPRNQGTVNATFYGTFRAAKGPNGDGYAFRFDAKSAKAMEIVSTSGSAPALLSPRERRKLFRGNARNRTANVCFDGCRVFNNSGEMLGR
jgi:hypothetical protein